MEEVVEREWDDVEEREEVLKLEPEVVRDERDEVEELRGE